MTTGWWFGTWLILVNHKYMINIWKYLVNIWIFMTFHIGNNHANWRTHIFQRDGSTTNQTMFLQVWVSCNASISKFEASLVVRVQGSPLCCWPCCESLSRTACRKIANSCKLYPIGSMYGIYANIWGILMVNVTIYNIHGSYGYGYRLKLGTPVDG